MTSADRREIKITFHTIGRFLVAYPRPLVGVLDQMFG
jgi:hypothetical protein